MPNDILERARAVLAANGRGPDAVPDVVEGDVSGEARSLGIPSLGPPPASGAAVKRGNLSELDLGILDLEERFRSSLPGGLSELDLGILDLEERFRDASGDARRVLANNGRHGAEQDFADIQLSDAMMNILGSPIAKSLPDLEAFRESAERSRKFEEQARRGFKRMIHKMANPPPSRGEKLLNAGNAFFRGIGQGGAAIPKGMALAAKALQDALPDVFPEDADKDIEDYFLQQIGTAIDNFAKEQFPQDPRLAESFIAEKLPQGFGSMAAFMLSGGVAKLAGGSRILAMAAAGSVTEASGQFEEARSFGASEEDAMKAAGLGAVVGLSEVLPAERIFRRFNKASGGQLKSFLKRTLTDAAAEGGQEFASAVATNKIAQEIYDKERNLVNTLAFESGGIGGIVGGVASAIAQGAGILNARQLARSLRQTDPRAAIRLEANKVPSRRDVAGTLAKELKSVRERRAFADELREPKLAIGEKTLPLNTEQQQQQEAEASAEKPVVRTPAETSGFVSMEDLSKKIGQGLRGARSFATRFFTSKGHLPKEAFVAKVARDGEINSQLQQIRFTLKDYDKAIKKEYGSRKKMPEEAIRTANAVLQGQQSVTDLPESLREHVMGMRNQIDALSRRLIDDGVVEGKLAAHIDENIGFYTNRSYRVFDDPKWADNVPEETRNIAKAFIRSEYRKRNVKAAVDAELISEEATEAEIQQAIDDGVIEPDLTEDQLHGKIKKYLVAGKAAQNPIALISKGSKLGSKDLSILKRRGGIPVEIRELFGEYHDERINYARSASKMAHLIANDHLLNDIREQGLGSFLFEKPESSDRGDFIIPIAAKESSVMAPLNGLHTTPEIEAAFRRVMEVEEHPWYFKHYMKLNSTVKFSKTIGSLMTHVRNLTGNTGFAVANGHYRFWKTPEAIRIVKASFMGSDENYRQQFRRLQELGVVGDNARAGELKAILKDSLGKDPNVFLDETSGKYGKKIVNFAVGAYRVEDDVWKIYAFLNEKQRYGKAFPDMPKAELEQLAADNVRNTYPTYSLVPEAIQRLRRFPGVGTFTSFPAEVARTGYNSIRLAERDLSNPATRAIGFERLAGLLLAATGTAALATASRFLSGVDKEEDEDVRLFLPPWSRNSQIIHFGKQDDGTYRTIDLSYTDPYEYLKKPVIALMRGETWEEGLWVGLWQATEPFLSEEILAGRVLDVLRNKKKDTGGPVYNEEAEFPDKVADGFTHVFGAAVPGTIQRAGRIAKGIKGEVSTTGKAYDPVLDGLAEFTGTRVHIVDVPQSLFFAAGDFKRRMSKATRILSTVAGRRGAVSDDEIRAAYQASSDARTKIFTEMTRKALAAERLGVGRKEITRILKDAKVSPRDRKAILSGSYPSYSPSSSFLRAKIKRVGVLPGDEGSADKKEFIRRRNLVRQLSGR